MCKCDFEECPYVDILDIEKQVEKICEMAEKLNRKDASKMTIENVKRLTKLEQGIYIEKMLNESDFISRSEVEQEKSVKRLAKSLRCIGYTDDMTIEAQDNVSRYTHYFKTNLLNSMEDIPFTSAINAAVKSYIVDKIESIENGLGILPCTVDEVDDETIMLFGDMPIRKVSNNDPKGYLEDLGIDVDGLQVLSEEEFIKYVRGEEEEEKDPFLSDDLDLPSDCDDYIGLEDLDGFDDLF